MDSLRQAARSLNAMLGGLERKETSKTYINAQAVKEGGDAVSEGQWSARSAKTSQTRRNKGEKRGAGRVK